MVKKLTAEKVQLWSSRIMLTVISKKEAEELLDSEKYFIISGQAIGYKE